MGDILPPKRQAVVDRLKRRFELYRHHQGVKLPCYDQTINSIYEQQKQETLLLKQRFLESKAKKSKKSDQKNAQKQDTLALNAANGSDVQRNLLSVSQQQQVSYKSPYGNYPGPNTFNMQQAQSMSYSQQQILMKQNPTRIPNPQMQQQYMQQQQGQGPPQPQRGPPPEYKVQQQPGTVMSQEQILMSAGGPGGGGMVTMMQQQQAVRHFGPQYATNPGDNLKGPPGPQIMVGRPPVMLGAQNPSQQPQQRISGDVMPAPHPGSRTVIPSSASYHQGPPNEQGGQANIYTTSAINRTQKAPNVNVGPDGLNISQRVPDWRQQQPPQQQTIQLGGGPRGPRAMGPRGVPRAQYSANMMQQQQSMVMMSGPMGPHIPQRMVLQRGGVPMSMQQQHMLGVPRNSVPPQHMNTVPSSASPMAQMGYPQQPQQQQLPQMQQQPTSNSQSEPMQEAFSLDFLDSIEGPGPDLLNFDMYASDTGFGGLLDDI